MPKKSLSAPKNAVVKGVTYKYVKILKPGVAILADKYQLMTVNSCTKGWSLWTKKRNFL